MAKYALFACARPLLLYFVGAGWVPALQTSRDHWSSPFRRVRREWGSSRYRRPPTNFDPPSFSSSTAMLLRRRLVYPWTSFHCRAPRQSTRRLVRHPGFSADAWAIGPEHVPLAVSGGLSGPDRCRTKSYILSPRLGTPSPLSPSRPMRV